MNFTTPQKFLPFLLLFSIAGTTFCGASTSQPAPIVLHVSSVTIQDNTTPEPAAAALLSQDPESPVDALITVLQKRLETDGTPGKGAVTIQTASIEPVGNHYVGVLSIKLVASSADGKKSGATQASVSVTQPAPAAGAPPEQAKAILADISNQLANAMAVQLQNQLQHDMPSWIAPPPAAIMAPPSHEDSSAPGSFSLSTPTPYGIPATNNPTTMNAP